MPHVTAPVSRTYSTDRLLLVTRSPVIGSYRRPGEAIPFRALLEIAQIFIVMH